MNFQEITGSTEYKEFVKISKEISNYLKEEKIEPTSLAKKYKTALKKYRVLLDKNKMKMPRQQFFFIKDDKSTHRYLDCKLSKNSQNETTFVGSVENPNWIYK